MGDFDNTLVQLGPREKEIINRTVIERDLGGKAFSVALRMIIREWDEMKAMVNPTPQGKQQKVEA